MAWRWLGMSEAGHPPEDRREILDARWNVACAFLIFFATLGIPAIMIPVLYAPIIDETGWSRGDVAMLTSVKFGVGAVAAYLTGHLVERFGVRPVTIACGAISGIALLLMPFVHALWTFYLIGALLGISALGVTTAMKIFVSQWFSRRQGLAIGASLMGTSCAGVIVPYLTTLLSQEVGWRMTCAIMSLFIWVVALPFFIWRARERKAEQIIATAQAVAGSHPDAPTFAQVRFTRPFLAAAVICFLVGAVDHGLIAHLVIYFDRDIHLGAEVAAIGFSVVMVMSNVGKLGYGWVFDRYSMKGLAACWFIVTVGVLLTLPISGLATLALFAIIYGPTQGGMLVSVPVIAKHCFGPRAMARAIAVLTTVFMAGSSAGPAMAGYLHDMLGNYTLAFLLFALFALIAGVLSLMMNPRYHTAFKPRVMAP